MFLFQTLHKLPELNATSSLANKFKFWLQMSPLLQHFVNQFFTFLCVCQKLSITGKFSVQCQVGFKFLQIQVDNVDILLRSTNFAPCEPCHVSNDILVKWMQLFICSLFICAFTQLTFLLFLLPVTLLDFSLKFKLQTFCDLWTNLLQNFFNFILCCKFALSQFKLKLSSFVS